MSVWAAIKGNFCFNTALCAYLKSKTLMQYLQYQRVSPKVGGIVSKCLWLNDGPPKGNVVQPQLSNCVQLSAEKICCAILC